MSQAFEKADEVLGRIFGEVGVILHAIELLPSRCDEDWEAIDNLRYKVWWLRNFIEESRERLRQENTDEVQAPDLPDVEEDLVDYVVTKGPEFIANLLSDLRTAYDDLHLRNAAIQFDRDCLLQNKERRRHPPCDDIPF